MNDTTKENNTSSNLKYLKQLPIVIVATAAVVVFMYISHSIIAGRTGMSHLRIMWHGHPDITNNVEKKPYRYPSACRRSDIQINLTLTRSQQCLFYNRVPKCGSAMVRDVIKQLSGTLGYKYALMGAGKHPGEEHLQKYHYTQTNMQQQVQDILNLCQKKQVIIRHLHFANIQQKMLLYTNMIRDPVDHYISWYTFRRHHLGTFGMQLVPFNYRETFRNSSYKMDFDECVRTAHPECTDYNLTFTIIPYFCGADDYCLTPSARSLNQAKENVIKHFPVVGYLENHTQYLELCEVVWPQYYTGAAAAASQMIQDRGVINSNTYREMKEPSVVSKKIMALHLKIEYEFYYWVKERFDCMYNFYVKRQV